MLSNRSFENGTSPWVITSNIAIVDGYATMNHEPGSPPGSPGTWGLHNVTNGTQSQGNVTQTVVLAPGIYKFRAAIWANVYDDGGGTTSQARLRVEADGQTLDFDNNGMTDNIDLDQASGGWTGWTQLQTPTYTMQVNSNLLFFYRGRSNAQTGGVWGQTAADLARLDVELQTPPTVTSAEYPGVDSSIPGVLNHQFEATDLETGAGPFTWDQLTLLSYTPNYGGDPSPAGIANGTAQGAVGVNAFLTSGGAFSWNSVGAPRGDYVWRVRASDDTNIDGTGEDLSGTGTITVRVVSVPEPASFVLLGLALIGLAALRHQG